MQDLKTPSRINTNSTNLDHANNLPLNKGIIQHFTARLLIICHIKTSQSYSIKNSFLKKYLKSLINTNSVNNLRQLLWLILISRARCLTKMTELMNFLLLTHKNPPPCLLTHSVEFLSSTSLFSPPFPKHKHI